MVNNSFATAIVAHLGWKSMLQSVLESRSGEVSPGDLRQDDRCRFGHWLRRLEDLYRDQDIYWRCCELHRQFHETAANVLEIAMSGRPDADVAALEATRALDAVSESLTAAMLEWSSLSTSASQVPGMDEIEGRSRPPSAEGKPAIRRSGRNRHPK